MQATSEFKRLKFICKITLLIPYQQQSLFLTYLCNHVSIVVIAECPTQFLIVHCWFVFTFTPQLCHHFWIVQFKFPFISKPLDNTTVLFVCQQLQQELPQLDLAIVPCQKQYKINLLPSACTVSTHSNCYISRNV